MSADTSCLTPVELARRWRCRPSVVRRLIAMGALAAFALPGSRGLRAGCEGDGMSEEEMDAMEAMTKAGPELNSLLAGLARQDIPRLVAEVRRLRDELKHAYADAESGDSLDHRHSRAKPV